MSELLIKTQDATVLEHLQKPTMLIGRNNNEPSPLDLLTQGSLTLITAAPYTGKTFCALEIARAIAYGSKAFGHYPVPTLSRGNVLLLEQDAPMYDTGRAFWQMIRDQVLPLKDPETGWYGRNGENPIGAVQIAWHPNLDLKNTYDAQRIIETANRLETIHLVDHREGLDEGYWGTKLIILDTLRELHSAEENSSTEMRQVLKNIKDIRNSTKATVLILHHSSKGDFGSPTRGSTAIDGAIDNHFHLTRSKLGIRATCKKSRGVSVDPFTFEIVTENDTKLVRLTTTSTATSSEHNRLILEEASALKAQYHNWLALHPKAARSAKLAWGAANNRGETTLWKWEKEFLHLASQENGNVVDSSQ